MSLINHPAPTFIAPAVVEGQIVQDFSLSSWIGKQPILLFFYPKDFTFVCPTELLALQKRLHLFQERGVAVIAISTDSVETHFAWLQTPVEEGGIQGVTYPLVADESKAIAANYEALGGTWDYDEDGLMIFEGNPFAYRASFLIDEEGIIRYASTHDLGLGRNIDELLRVVDMWRKTKQDGTVCPAGWQAGEATIEPTPLGIKRYIQENPDSPTNCQGACKGKTTK
ncbi:MAG: peroxiredoxin [Bacteroidota bacterium]